MVRAVIVDDELDSLQGMQLLLNACCPDVETVGIAQTISEAKTVIESQTPDLLFLDVELANATGFDLLKAIDHKNLLTVFVTAHGHYAFNAIKANAIDFLLKPVESTDLIRTVDRAKERLLEKSFVSYAQILQNINQPTPRRLEIPTRHGSRFIEIDSIEYVKADGNYSTLYLTGSNTVMVSRQLGSFEEALPDSDFVRIHKSYIINVNQLSSYERIEGGIVEMNSGKRLDVSRKYKSDLLNAIKGKSSRL